MTPPCPPATEGLRPLDDTDKWWDRSGPGARYRRWVALGLIPAAADPYADLTGEDDEMAHPRRPMTVEELADAADNIPY